MYSSVRPWHSYFIEPRGIFSNTFTRTAIFSCVLLGRVGKELKLPRQPAPAELTYEIRQPIPSTLVALVILPQPRIEKEAYFAAMIYRPHRVTPFLRISDTTKMLVLEYRLNREGQPITVLIEWSKRQKYLLIGRGPEPELEAFYGAVLEQL